MCVVFVCKRECTCVCLCVWLYLAYGMVLEVVVAWRSQKMVVMVIYQWWCIAVLYPVTNSNLGMNYQYNSQEFSIVKHALANPRHVIIVQQIRNAEALKKYLYITKSYEV